MQLPSSGYKSRTRLIPRQYRYIYILRYKTYLYLFFRGLPLVPSTVLESGSNYCYYFVSAGRQFFIGAHRSRDTLSLRFQVAAAKSDNVQTFSRILHRFQFKSYARERARSFFFFQISRWNIVSFTIRDQVSVKFYSRNPHSSVRKNYLRTREACLPALSRERKKKSEKLKVSRCHPSRSRETRRR